jgi:hypothetical protein
MSVNAAAYAKDGYAQNLLPFRDTSGQGPFRSRDFVTSCQKATLGRIWHNFRLRMRIIYFLTWLLPVIFNLAALLNFTTTCQCHFWATISVDGFTSQINCT